jgi:prepilin-type N-terminal cleavage/methylation domain-containing protein
VKRHLNAGFTLIEALIVVAISVVLAGIAIPTFMTTMRSYNQSATVAAAAAAISSTRMQAIMRGYPYEVVFTPSSLSYQIYNEAPPAATYSLVVPQIGSSTTPLPNAGGVTMAGWVSCTVTSPPTLTGCTAMAGTTVTYTFLANGTVTSNPAGVGLQIKNVVKSNTMWVSGVGNVSTSSP